jgi:hypothetical protein
MNLQEDSNHQLYMQVLKRMTPSERLKKAFEPTELKKRLLLYFISKKYPEKTKEEVMKMFIEILKRKAEEELSIFNHLY